MAVNNPAPQKKSKLDTVANIAIILVCAIAAAVLVRNQFFPPRPPGAPPQAEKGETYAQLKNVVPAGSNRALVVAVQPGCHFCNDSMTFYKQLIDQRNSQASKVKFVAVVPANDKPEDAKKLVDDEQQKFASAGAQPDSMAFYKQVIDQRNSQASKVKFVAVVPANDKPADAKKLVDDEQQKFASAGAQPDSMANVDFSAIKVPGTPTLMLVDNNGKILNVWVGKLDPSGEKEVLKVL
ncbi:MAG TPA: hypothetical protein VIE43_17025 [Thermoanaerobaculia bacterium]|nr:hypothetical protein [Thermoanaerobaculia bacterium]